MSARLLASDSWGPQNCWGGGDTATRNPLLLFVFVGSLLLRFADRQFLALLFQEPPRNTREPPNRTHA